MIRIIFLLVFLSAFNAFSQTVTVVNSETGEPAVNVAIYNKSKKLSTYTNIDGKARLDKFDLDENLYFQAISYLTIRLTKNQIIANDNLVGLTPRSETIDPIVISASKFEQRERDIPQKIIAIPGLKVQEYQPQTTADFLEQTGQVFVQKSQQGGGSPMIRGFSTNRLLITVDGVRMNNAIFRGGNLQNIISIDPLSIDRSEVILGPGSVVYGSDAIGGVMNFYTAQPKFAQDSSMVSGRVMGRYSSANNENTVHARFNYHGDQWATATSISLNYFDDLRMGEHGPDDYLRLQYQTRANQQDVVVDNPDPRVQISSGYDQINLLQKVSYEPSLKWRLDASLIYTATSDYSRYDALTRFRESGEPRNAAWYYGPQKWLLAHGVATHRGNGKWYDKLVISQSFQKAEESRNTRSFQSNSLFRNKEQVNIWSTSVDAERRDRENNVLFYGVEFIHNRVNSKGSEVNIETNEVQAAASRYPDGASWRSLAAYFNYQWSIKKNLTLQSGLRYNHIWLNADFDQRFFDFPFQSATVNTGALTGAAGLTYLPNPSWELRANFSTAFRAPNVDDVGKIFDPDPGTLIVPNPDVESEYSYNTELGVKRKWKNVQFEIAGYHTFLKDALVPRPFSFNGQDQIDYQGETRNVFAIQNGQEARIWGIEVAGKWNLENNWSIKGTYTHVNGEQTEEDGSKENVRHVAPDFGRLEIEKTGSRWNAAAWVMFNGELGFNDLDPTQRNRPYLYALDEDGNPYSPRWYTFNVRGNYQLKDDITATVIIENITDQRYRTYSSGIAAAGRNLIVALRFDF